MALNVTNIHPIMRGVSNSNKNTYSNHHTTSVIRGPNPSINLLEYGESHLPSYLNLQIIDPYLGQYYDKFGIAELYPSKQNGEKWFMNMTDPNHDPRFDIAHDERFDKKSILIKNQDGSWKERSPQVRLDVLTSIGYIESKIATLNQTKLSSKGYMQSPRDWKNTEVTGFVKFNKGKSEKKDDSDELNWYARGGDHETPNKGCEGSAYKGQIIL